MKMLRMPVPFTLSLALLSCILTCPLASAQQTRLLWQIGMPDNRTAEFALAPADYAKFSDDALFVVGASEAKRDWPYVQPGPADVWAGARSHTFTVCFGLKQKPTATCRLRIDLADTQALMPPEVRIDVNGQTVLNHKTPSGSGDMSITGDLSHAHEHRFAVNIEPAVLKKGANEITITTISGSWMLYDWIGFDVPKGVELAPLSVRTRVARIDSPAVLVERDGKLCQPVRLSIQHIGDLAEAIITATGAKPVTAVLKRGTQEIEVAVLAVDKETAVTVAVESAGKTLAERRITLKPVRKWIVYLLPHSHVDIGYTQLQADVLKKQWHNLEIAEELADKSAGNPAGARFKWNAEVLWPIDNYLRLAPPEKQQSLVDAIKAGHIELDALYGNELTALCRPEELMRLAEAAGRIGKRCGVKVESAMISDVPGYTWGVVPVLASAGVKYFSAGPNAGERIGRLAAELADKPFYWISPSGTEKVLCWIAGTSYGTLYQDTLAHGGEEPLLGYLRALENEKYPYDLVQVRYTVFGDNGPPDPTLADSVKRWNAKYAYPKMVIATTTEMMKEFERRYADKIPRLRGDITPYWEDGAASSARDRLEPHRRRTARAGRNTLDHARSRPVSEPSGSRPRGETCSSTTNTPGARTTASPSPTCRS